MTSENSLSAADIAAVTGNRGGMGGFGYGDGSIIWVIILLLFTMFNGGWGNNNGGMNGMGMYPWLNNSNQINDGFQNQMLFDNVSSIRDGVYNIGPQLCNGFAGVTAAVNNGFAQAEISANARQMADMNQMFGFQSAVQNGFCDNRAGIADLKYTVAQENCLDRNQAMLNTRDIIEAIRTGNQQIMDNQNAYRLEQKNDRIAELERQLAEARLNASQIAQDQRITDSVYNRFKDCPVDARPVYGNTPIFTCNQNQSCVCGNGFYN